MASASGDLELISYLVQDLNCSPSIDEEPSLLLREMEMMMWACTSLKNFLGF